MKVKNTKTRSIVSEKHQRIMSKVVLIGGIEDADYRKCMQEYSRKFETMLSWENHAAAKAGAIWEPVDCGSNSIWRIQHDTHAPTS